MGRRKMRFLSLLICFTFIGAEAGFSIKEKSSHLIGNIPPQLKTFAPDTAKLALRKQPNAYDRFFCKDPNMPKMFPDPTVDAKILKIIPWLDRRGILGKRWKEYRPRLIQRPSDSLESKIIKKRSSTQ